MKVIIHLVAEQNITPTPPEMVAWTVMNAVHATGKTINSVPVAVHQNKHAKQENTVKYLAQMTPN